jgi:hypothetical protein
MPTAPRRQLGVVAKTKPLTILSQRKRFVCKTEEVEALAVGDVVSFLASDKLATNVRKKRFQGAPIEFTGLRDWAPGRQGIVTAVADPPYPGATIVDTATGEIVGREGNDGLRVGDEVTYDLMSDYMAVDLRLKRSK